jgi:hypothetical protein
MVALFWNHSTAPEFLQRMCWLLAAELSDAGFTLTLKPFSTTNAYGIEEYLCSKDSFNPCIFS